MSTIKWKFNVWTIAMFVGCLALSIMITQPLLARADNEWWNNAIIETTFSDAKNMSLDTLNVSNSMNVWNSHISDWEFCNSEGTCLSLDWDMLSVNKIKIWNWDLNNPEVVLISGNMLYATANPILGFDETRGVQLNSFYGVVYDTNIKDYILQYLFDRWFARGERLNEEADNERPVWELYWLKFNHDDTLPCSSDTEWTVRYVSNNNWSQLIMCMKISSTDYSGVVLKEFTN